MVPIARAIAQERNDVDVFTLDHRGVGFSTRLGCPQEPGVFAPGDGGALDDAAVPDPATALAPCLAALQAKWGSELAFFTASNAARDLAYAIDRTKKPGQEVYVYGVSYGTYWAHRYLQIFPEHPTGVILDSIVPPEGEALSQFDLHGDLAGAKLGELCKKDAVCNQKLGPDPWARVKDIVATIGTGHCPELGLTNANRSVLFGYLQQWGLNVYPFAALWRYERCTPEDVTVLRALAERTAVFSPAPGLFSPLLGYNVRFSELWEQPAPSQEVLLARYAAATFPAGAAFDVPRSVWPAYPTDEFYGKYAQTSVPLLMLNGTLDVQTPIETASRMKDHLNGPHQTFIAIPNANHATIQQSPTRALAGAGGQGPPCGFTIVMSFLDDPKGPLDTSCLSNLLPLDFSGDSAANDYFFGTKSIWTGAPSTQRSAIDPRSPIVRALPRFVDPRPRTRGL
jgi:pimeloyl-ACP methyl ester carboxylesterase